MWAGQKPRADLAPGTCRSCISLSEASIQSHPSRSWHASYTFSRDIFFLKLPQPCFREECIDIGEKRNELAKRARGQFLVHFDDDDFYGEESLPPQCSLPIVYYATNRCFSAL